MRQHIGRTERDHSQPRRRSQQSVRNLGDRPVAAGGNHHRCACARCLPRQRLRVSRTMRLGQFDADAVRYQDIEHPPQQVGATQSRDRIEHDNHRAARIGEMTMRIESTSSRQAALLPRSLLQPDDDQVTEK